MVKRFLPYFAVVVIVFSLGLLVGKYGLSTELNQIEKMVKNSELAAESFVIEQDLLEGKESCSLAESRISGLSFELWRLGKVLGSGTARQELGDEQYRFLKKKYHLSQIKTYTLYKKLENDCSTVLPRILFYYQQNDPDSGEQGAILDRLVSVHNVTVFAIEFQYDDALAFLERYYNITQAPSIVVNDKEVRGGLTNYEEIERLLG